jgi:hypothetical protein
MTAAANAMRRIATSVEFEPQALLKSSRLRFNLKACRKARGCASTSRLAEKLEVALQPQALL